MKLPMATVACCAAGLTIVAQGQAQQPSQEFQLAFCNISTFSNVLVSLAYRRDGQQWTVDGWYPIPDYGCAQVGSFPRDSVYYYAVGETNDGRPEPSRSIPSRP